jgi:hypothetical protein
MRFVNLTDKALDFEIDRVRYKAAPGGDCVPEIPDAIAFVVSDLKLPLTSGDVADAREAALVARRKMIDEEARQAREVAEKAEAEAKAKAQAAADAAKAQAELKARAAAEAKAAAEAAARAEAAEKAAAAKAKAEETARVELVEKLAADTKKAAAEVKTGRGSRGGGSREE